MSAVISSTVVAVTVAELSSKRGVVAKVLSFAAVSGVGLALDVVIFLLLTEVGWRAGFANATSAFAAVSFVYFTSTRHVFSYQGRFLLPLFGAYLLYQVVAVFLASWAVDSLVGFGMSPLISKAVILPVTFTCNYTFMAFLTKT